MKADGIHTFNFILVGRFFRHTIKKEDLLVIYIRLSHFNKHVSSDIIFYSILLGVNNQYGIALENMLVMKKILFPRKVR